MTGPTLAVDSESIRAAATIVDQAAAAFAGGGTAQRPASPLTDGSLGASAAAQAAVAAAARQLARGQDATLGLAERTHTIAGAMTTAATFFDIVDSTIGALR
ncbi:hypothetical protein [Nakamurella multipartita]|jgi:hypothetical protein|uniref:PE domain-containing protein n=1 Tax=Nakamurella multipartita (strain ATCC 700099 / DSM 44233 / CIP 104796 / JCM 9543 / NBRC 105858 / Y-104) TaxID=479431 RepID=C8XJ49_NAKMY|nr:hypothetical protein [Nakamurella multipartita]ACV78514.1 hypothetical protein Namu_2136 [Nakamurella multipartita DSM 44233]HOZ57241.1 hypothetical protein [Nakamurella multipartita]